MRLALLPFVSKRGIVRAADLMDAEAFENAQRYSDRLRLLIDALCAGFEPDTVNVLAAHAFVLGAATGGGERPAHLVDEYAVTAPSFPRHASATGPSATCTAPQRIPAGAGLHYCGSPLQLDFGEGEQAKQVNVVTIDPGVPADVRPSGSSSRPTAAHADAARSTSWRRSIVDGDPWLRVVVRGPAPGRPGRRRPAPCSGRAWSTCASTAPAAVTAARRRDHHGRSPQDLFDEYLAGEGVDDDRIRTLFADLLDAQHDGQSTP